MEEKKVRRTQHTSNVLHKNIQRTFMNICKAVNAHQSLKKNETHKTLRVVWKTRQSHKRHIILIDILYSPSSMLIRERTKEGERTKGYKKGLKKEGMKNKIGGSIESEEGGKKEGEHRYMEERRGGAKGCRRKKGMRRETKETQ